MPIRITSPDDYQRLAEFRYRIRAFLSFSERAARAAGIEPQQHQLLLACKGLPTTMRPTIGTLAQRLCIEHHSAVALVDKLQARKLVRRAPSQADRREVLIIVTPEGEKLLAKLSALHKAQLMQDGPGLLAALALIISAGAQSDAAASAAKRSRHDA
jgi:DNA-binding MarR family transcriptional regulator